MTFERAARKDWRRSERRSPELLRFQLRSSPHNQHLACRILRDRLETAVICVASSGSLGVWWFGGWVWSLGYGISEFGFKIRKLGLRAWGAGDSAKIVRTGLLRRFLQEFLQGFTMWV